uniref:Uncharacterized protein n=1 Tax=Arundo donax TaxID=35708 RepID=A0A0A9ETF4_ARUDO
MLICCLKFCTVVLHTTMYYAENPHFSVPIKKSIVANTLCPCIDNDRC